ncbi:hypothetical protein TNCV_1821631 [Trichonephila clavipes]|nr:hypothetical protein TNCV_1821631 [Trichonephila clavipes]
MEILIEYCVANVESLRSTALGKSSLFDKDPVLLDLVKNVLTRMSYFAPEGTVEIPGLPFVLTTVLLDKLLLQLFGTASS